MVIDAHDEDKGHTDHRVPEEDQKANLFKLPQYTLGQVNDRSTCVT